MNQQVTPVKTEHFGFLLVDQYSIEQTSQYMSHIQATAEALVRRRLATIEPGYHRFVDRMDSGQTIALTIDRRNGDVVFDFDGTDPVAANNLNANRAIVSAAIMYCLRVMVGEDIP